MASLDDQPQQPVASSSTTPLCAQCSSQPAKYTCPGCSTKTCSLPCSKAHKVSTSCSGKRNPASYVPMNAYSYASMVSDYTFLSGVGRTLDAATAAVGVPNAMLLGPGNKAGGGGSASFKTEGLRRRMNEAGLGGVRFMPEGMERRSKNQTRWNMKTQSLLLTVCLSPQPPATRKVLQHSLPLSTTLSSLLPKLSPAPISPTYLLPHPTSSKAKPTYYRPLDGGASLQDVLRGKQWLEWPEFEVWETDSHLEGQVFVDEEIGQASRTWDGEQDGGGERKKMRVWGPQKVEGEEAVTTEGGEEEEEEEEEEEKAKDEEDVASPLPPSTAAAERAQAAALAEVAGLGGLLGGYGSDSDEDDSDAADDIA